MGLLERWHAMDDDAQLDVMRVAAERGTEWDERRLKKIFRDAREKGVVRESFPEWCMRIYERHIGD